MPKHGRLALAILLGALAPACANEGSPSGTPGSAGTTGAAGNSTGAAGNNTGAAGNNTGAAGDNTGAAGNNTGAAGNNTGAAGAGAAGTGAAGTGAAGTGAAGAAGTGAAGTGAAGGKAGTGAAGTGAAGTGAAGTGAAGIQAGDTPPHRALNVTVAPGQHVHQIFGNSVGMDNRAAKMAGKMVVELGVDSGGYDGWLGKRGFHVFGVKFFHCGHIDAWGAPYGRDYHANCRWTTFDGKQRGGAENDANAAVNDTNSIAAKVKMGLNMLKTMAPGEDWEYFLTPEGEVRWSDVAFTGYSHGAQSAAAFGHLVRLYRAVSRSGPRDNNCGKGTLAGNYDPANPPFDPNCPMTGVAAWQDAPWVTPVDRFFSFAGKMDGQFGDDMYSTWHMKYVGDVVNISTAAPPYGGSHRFIADDGHGGFDTDKYMDAENIAFGVLTENLKPTF